MNLQAATSCTRSPAFPLHLAVPLPCDAPRRPCPPPMDPRRLRVPRGERALHCPDRFQADVAPVGEPSTC